jgi:4-amino-4-deoxy-L-arabinose transferase-like glycosyltransferase
MTGERLLTRRDAIAWTGAFLIVAALLVVTGFTSDDPDSALYAGLSARLAQEPPSRWIAPEWWGFWPEAEMTGLFREHPAGVLLLPTALTVVGIPAARGAYVVGVGAGLLSLVLIGSLIQRASSREEARAALVLLQLMPVAFIFRIRANHEYPMLLCLVAALWGLSAVRRTWAGAFLVAGAVTAGLLIKGVFVLLILIGALLWLVLNPLGEQQRPLRPWIAFGAALAAMVAAAAGYDAWYSRVAGETFWLPYWQRQLGPVTIASPLEDAGSFARNFLFYLSRLIWHPAPWSIALVVGGWRWYRGGSAAAPDPADRSRRVAVVFAVTFALLSILVLTPSSRFAERYAFSATWAIAAAGVVAAYQVWPTVRRWVRRADADVAALPALVWLALMILRLVSGPMLPRL